MGRFKKITFWLSTVIVVLFSQSCGKKNFGSYYYAGKMNPTINYTEIDEYSQLNEILEIENQRDSISTALVLISKEEMLISEVIQDLIQKQNARSDSTDLLGEEIRTEEIVKDSIQTIPADSLFITGTSPTTLIQKNDEPFFIRDTKRSIVHDSISVRHIDSIRVVNQVVVTDTVFKTIIVNDEYSPATEYNTSNNVVPNKNNSIKENDKKNDEVKKKSTTIIPIIIPPSKPKKDTISKNEPIQKIDSIRADTLISPSELDTTAFVELKSAPMVVDSSLLMKPKTDSERIAELELKLEKSKEEILAKLNQLIELNASEKIVLAPKVEVAKTIIEQPINKEVIFYFANNTLIPKNENELIDEIINVIRKSEKYQIYLSGYTDLSGSPTINLNLSKKRVSRIQQELVRNGVDPKNIFVQHFGSKYAVSGHPDSQRKVECLIEITKQ